MTDYEAAEVEQAKRIVREKLASKLLDLAIPFELDIVTEYALEGVDSVGRAICDVAEELDVACIVMSSHNKVRRSRGLAERERERERGTFLLGCFLARLGLY